VQEEYDESWNIPGIKNFYTKSPDEPFWKKLCKEIASGNLKN